MTQALLRTALSLTLGLASVAAGPSRAVAPAAASTALKDGDKVVVKPLDMQRFQVDSHHDAKDVVLQIFDEGTPIANSDIGTVTFYKKKGDHSPLRVITLAELAQMADATGCRQTVKDLYPVRGPGEALFCNGSLELNSAGFFVLHRQGHDDEEASSIAFGIWDSSLKLLHAALVFDDD